MIKLPKPSDLSALITDNVLGAAFSHAEAIVHELRNATHVHASNYHYSVDTARSLAQLAGSGATLWLIHKKARVAKTVSLATAVVVAGLSVASRFSNNDDADQTESQTSEELKLRERIVNVALDWMPNIMATGLLYTSDARGRLTQPLDLAPRNPLVPFTFAEHARNAISLYAAYTMVGHWAEMLFCQLIKLGIVDGDYDRSNTMLWDWWLHPFPAEGIAGILIAGGLSPLRNKLLQLTGGRVLPALAASFLINQLVCTSIDYLTGMVANRNYELWDYRDMPFNFQGQICLQNSLVYTTAATLVAWLAYPARDSWLRTVPADIANTVFAGFMPTYAFVSALYFL